MEKGVNNLKSSEIISLEAEVGKLTPKQKELVKILSKINFDFENYEPIFVQFPGTEKYYVYQARKDALVELDDIVLVPTNGESNFKTATVFMTFDWIGEYYINDMDFSQVEHVVNSFKNVRHIVANLGRLDGAFFDDYLYEISRKERRNELIEAIEQRAKVAKKNEYFMNIAKFDSTMSELLEELDELGGF